MIESTKADLVEELRDEVRALRAQVDNLATSTPTRSWAAVAAGPDNTGPRVNRQRADQNCIRISTQRTYVDPRDNEDGDGNAFGRYLPTPAANTPSTQDVQIARIGTTKTGYVILFKDPESAEMARNNTEWLNELGKRHETGQAAARDRRASHSDAGIGP